HVAGCFAQVSAKGEPNGKDRGTRVVPRATRRGWLPRTNGAVGAEAEAEGGADPHHSGRADHFVDSGQLVLVGLCAREFCLYRTPLRDDGPDRKSIRLNSSHLIMSYDVI